MINNIKNYFPFEDKSFPFTEFLKSFMYDDNQQQPQQRISRNQDEAGDEPYEEEKRNENPNIIKEENSEFIYKNNQISDTFHIGE